MAPKKDVRDVLAGLEGFESATVHPMHSYRDCSTLFVTPTRGLGVDLKVEAAWRRMTPIQNQKRFYAVMQGGEVADAYNQAVAGLLRHEPKPGDAYDLRKVRYMMTLEDDNIPPWNAQIRLIEALEAGGFDGIGGIYTGKSVGGIPMAFGDPSKEGDIIPRDVREACDTGAVLEVNAIAMGCSLFRTDLFRDMEEPWFCNVAEPTGTLGHDIDFCLRARAKGKRFAVHCGVLVGHYDASEGLCYWPHHPPTRNTLCPG